MANVLGGVTGAVVGFFLGGPAGAIAGFFTGFGAFGIISAMMPDTPTPGDPNPEIQTMKSEIGMVLPELEGTAKITGQLLCFGKERNEKVYAEQASGKKGKGGKGGSSSPQVIGYRYYMSWAVGLVACPGDTNIKKLFSIYKNEDSEAVWSGDLECPASEGQETIAISDVGTVEFYFGTNDQIANTKVGEIIPDSTLNTPYRNMCWAFFDDCYIGAYNRTPSYHFIVQKITEFPFSVATASIGDYDVNPANVLYYILSNMSGLPSSWLDSTDFGTIASTLSTEQRGVSVNFGKQQSALGYVETINSHVDSIIRYGSDGKFHPKLIRDDYSIGSLPTIDESVLLDDPSFSRGGWIDTANEVRVQYSELVDVGYNANIFGLFSVGSLIWGVRFDGSTLTEIGYYESPSGDINGLVFKGDDLLTVGGIGSTASLRTINSETFILEDEDNPFNDYDAVVTGQGTLAINETTGKIYYTEGVVAGTGARQIALSSLLAKESRNFLGSVVIGTDSRYYLYDYYNEAAGWDPTWKPISGANYNSFWNVIEDDLFGDAVPIVWDGADPLRTSDAIFPRNLVYNGFLYSCMNSSPVGRIRKYNLDGLTMAETVTTGNVYQITACGGFIYSVEGTTSMTVKKFDADTLVFDSEVALSPGRPGDLTSASSYIIVLCSVYTGDSSIHKLSTDLEVVASTNLGTTLWQMVEGIDDTFVALGGNNEVGIFNIATMEMVDEIQAPSPTGAYYTTQELITKAG